MLPGIPAPSNNLNAEFPRIHPDGRITFRVQAPMAKKVQLVPMMGEPENNGVNGLVTLTSGDCGASACMSMRTCCSVDGWNVRSAHD